MPNEIDDPRIEKILFTEEQVNQRVVELADQINADYKGKEVIVVGILKGAFMFMAELVKRLKVDTQLEFMSLSSYGVGRSTTSGNVRLIMDTRTDVSGKHVLIVEDIIDSGYTLKYLLNLMQSRSPASLKTCVLLRKPDCAKVDVTPDYLAFDIPPVFVVGMGLDYSEQLRSPPFIAQLKKSVYEN